MLLLVWLPENPIPSKKPLALEGGGVVSVDVSCHNDIVRPLGQGRFRLRLR